MGGGIAPPGRNTARPSEKGCQTAARSPVASKTLATRGAARDPPEKWFCPTRTRRRHRLNAFSSRTGTAVFLAAWAPLLCAEWYKMFGRHCSVPQRQANKAWNEGPKSEMVPQFGGPQDRDHGAIHLSVTFTHFGHQYLTLPNRENSSAPSFIQEQR